MRNLVFCALTAITAVPAFADNLNAPLQLLQQARQSLQHGKITDWTYERTTVDKGTTYIEQFDPRARQPWQLLSINGKPPSPEQTKIYADGKNPVTGDALEQAPDGTPLGISRHTPGNLQANQLLGCMPANGLTVVVDTPQTITYQFKPDCSAMIAKIKKKIETDNHGNTNDADRKASAKTSAQTMQDMFAHTEGTLVLDKTGPYIESIQLKNPAPFTEMHVLKVKTFAVDNQFAPLAPDGKTVLVHDSVTMHATVFIFKTIEQHADVSFSDFKRIAPGA